MQIETDAVVLRQTRCLEKYAILVPREAVKDRAPVGGPNPARRQKAAEALADVELPQMGLREIVAVGAMGRFPPGRGERQDRDLHHVVGFAIFIYALQPVRIDDILGIVMRDNFEMTPPLFLIGLHAQVKPVQTVRF